MSPSEEQAVLRQFLDRIELFGKQIADNARLLAASLARYQQAVARLAKIAGLGADSAQQMIAEIGPRRKPLKRLHNCLPRAVFVPEGKRVPRYPNQIVPKGNRPMRRLLAQRANAAIKAKASVFELYYRRKAAHLGHFQAVWAVAHKLCRVIWKVLHDGVRYEERGSRLNSKREAKQLQRLKRTLGYLVTTPTASVNSSPTTLFRTIFGLRERGLRPFRAES